MRIECGRFEFKGELGVFDNMSKRYVSLNGEIKQIEGMQEVQFSDATKKLFSDFITKITPFIDSIICEEKQKRLKSNFLHDFNINLNEGFSN